MILAAILSASLAQTAFHELRSMCARDHGRLWGVSICGPTLFVDPKTREVVANGPVPSPTLPETMPLGNTAIDWNGTKWTEVLLPLPEDPYDRRVLLAHESFHRVAGLLSFGGGTEGGNAHLDTAEGRYWLELEWRALAAALRGDRSAVADALAFRARRRQLFPTATAEEHDLEMREGLAEYTGTALAEPDLAKRIPHLIQKLHEAESLPTFVRSFAYATGPAWGALLEMRDPGWTRRVDPTDDLADLMGQGDPQSADKRAERYGGPALLATERERSEKRQALMRELRAKLIDGPRLVLTLHKMNLDFDPTKAIAFEGFGTVYPTLTVHDDWGTIVVHQVGGLITRDWSHLSVPADPAAYTLTLNPGWVVVAGGRPGDLVVVKRGG